MFLCGGILSVPNEGRGSSRWPGGGRRRGTNPAFGAACGGFDHAARLGRFVHQCRECGASGREIMIKSKTSHLLNDKCEVFACECSCVAAFYPRRAPGGEAPAGRAVAGDGRRVQPSVGWCLRGLNKSLLCAGRTFSSVCAAALAGLEKRFPL